MSTDLPTQSILVDGMRDPKDENIEYWGQATPGPDGRWRCYANVYGHLCVVEVSIRVTDEETKKR
jgi:hypothetical protein